MNTELLELRKYYQSIGEPILRDKSFEILIDTVRSLNPKRILEIGTSVGLSSVAMLLNSDAYLTGIEIDEEKVLIAKSFYKEFGVYDRAKIFLGDSSEIIPVLTGKYDLIFLDGPKGHYYEYLDNLINALNVGGILFADDVLFHGYVKGKTPRKHITIKRSLEAYIKAVTENENLKTKILEIEDGICITEKLK